MKFKVGDIIEGRPSASEEYMITREGGELIVVGIDDVNGEIIIRIVKESPLTKDGGNIGRKYSVDPRHFQLINVDLTNE